MAQNTRLAARYAQSLLDLAIEKKKLDAFYKDAEAIKNTLANSRELLLLVKNPIVSTDKKQKVLSKVFKTKGKVNAITAKFIELVVKKKRESNLPEIFETFTKLYYKHNNTIEATVTTATGITATIQKQFESVIQKATGSKKIKYDVVIDKNILGGFILRFEDKIYDASVKGKLDKLKKHFTA